VRRSTTASLEGDAAVSVGRKVVVPRLSSVLTVHMPPVGRVGLAAPGGIARPGPAPGRCRLSGGD
jgi:hypothetical protein